MEKETIRPLGFVAALQHPEVQRSDKDLRNFYNEVADIIPFQSVNFSPGEALMETANKQTGEVKRCHIKPRELEIYNVYPGVGLDSFWQMADPIIEMAFSLLKVPIFLDQTYIITKLASPTRGLDSRIYLLENVCSIKDQNLDSFGRPVHIFGLRFYFPSSPEKPNEFEVRVDSWRRDIHSLWLECRGRFFVPPVQSQNRDQIRENLKHTEQFLMENTTKFLEQYNDRTTEGEKNHE